ncbi:glycoside hydrolase family 95 protein [Paenibacillus sp. HB172176]|uniref:glycoside hydrolase family 95 protein n=1 Tax=Paenibacillus sp. HB172176 TaxID=2493690 RepID=UPI001439302D|nr:glycoside hydrolase family 95 protein [Paenibacillus sp. HB172176]
MSKLKLSYSGPARSWSQGLPIGNGRLGAVVQSGVETESWSMTEITYWSGKPEKLEDLGKGKSALAEMREAFFAEEYERGEELAQRYLQPEKGNFGTNLTLADLWIEFEAAGVDMRRELDLQEAIVRDTCGRKDVSHYRETFATHADGIIVSRFFATEPGSISFKLGLNGRTSAFSAVYSSDGSIQFAGKAVEDMHSDGSCGVKASGELRLVVTGGELLREEHSLIVRGADEALLYWAAATDYGSVDDAWQLESGRLIDNAIMKGYERLKRDHIADYSKLFDRVSLRLGEGGRSHLPTDERIRRLMDESGEDSELFALFYQYGRYLTIAGSREDSPLPMNLQGNWNDGEANRMQWSCDYHLDVNTQMNYYPTEASNLAECHVPLMTFVKRLSESGREAAKAFYGCEGWVAHVFTNAWGFASPGWGFNWGLNVTGGLWIAAHLMEHYKYGRDSEFLSGTAYPVLKEAALFFLDYMTVHPKYGWLVTGPSNSPENSFYVGGETGKEYALSMGSTMDQMLVRELFEFCLASAEELDKDEELRNRLRGAIELLPPLQIGERGQLQEWLEDYGEAQPDHRHMSHLYGLYPGNQVTPYGTPKLSEALRKTLENRMSRAELEDVEFTLALFASGFARLRDGDNAHKQLSYLLGQLCFDNLFTYSKAGIAGAESNIFVIDGNFGGTAAIGEMLMQSHANEIDLLPALPKAWDSGQVAGLRARGNCEVDMVWSGGKLVEAVLKPSSNGTVRVRCGELTAELSMEAGRAYPLDGQLCMMQR